MTQVHRVPRKRRARKPCDPRDVPNYTIGEVAYWLAVPKNTLRNWLLGKVGMEPVLDVACRDPLGLSFWNLVESSVLASLRRGFGVRLREIRAAIDYVRDKLGLERPLIEQAFKTDGTHMFVERLGRLVCASQRGQLAINELLDASLQRVQWDKHGLASRLSPWRGNPNEPQILSVDPRVAFGKPVLMATNIPAESILERVRARESIESLSADFGIGRDKIEQLVSVFVEKPAA